MTEELWCKVGTHFWEREPTRGRKPIACPEHRDADVASMAKAEPVMETLRCDAGHEWTRKPTRGRKPQWCPEHRPTPQATGTPGTGKRRSKEVTRPQLGTSLAEIKRSYYVDDESERILAYIEGEIQSPDWPAWREQGDINPLVEAYHTRVRQIKYSCPVVR